MADENDVTSPTAAAQPSAEEVAAKMREKIRLQAESLLTRVDQTAAKRASSTIPATIDTLSTDNTSTANNSEEGYLEKSSDPYQKQRWSPRTDETIAKTRTGTTKTVS